MEIFISVVSVIVAFVALWLAADTQVKGEHQFRALLEGRIGGVRKEIDTLSAANRSATDDIGQLKRALTDARQAVTRAEQSVTLLTEEISEMRRQALETTKVDNRRRA